MDFKAELAKLSPKFEGIHVHLKAVDSRLHITVDLEASADLPGEMDSLVAAAAGVLGLGNSPTSSDSAQASQQA